MTTPELVEWFFDKLNSCYYATSIDYPDSIFFIYDESYIRKSKLCKIIGNKIISPTKINGICLFELDLIGCKLWCDYKEIWNILEDELENDVMLKFIETRNFIINTLKFKNKFKILQGIENEYIEYFQNVDADYYNMASSIEEKLVIKK